MDTGGMLRVLEVLFTEDAPARCPTTAERTEAAHLMGSVAEPSRAWLQPAQRSSERTFAWATVPGERMRKPARRHGASTNDVFLAGLALAASQWSAGHAGTAHGEDCLPFVVPVHIRRADEAQRPGNRTAFAAVSVPGGTDQVLQRLPHLPHVTTALKSPAHRTAIRENLDRIPAEILRLGNRHFPNSAGLLERPSVTRLYPP
jgi:hypothetical protein